MNKRPRTFATLDKWGDKTLDHAQADGMVGHLQERIEELRRENAELQIDLMRSDARVKDCASKLRKAREKNRKLHLKLGGYR